MSLAPATSCRSVVDSRSLQLQQPAAAAFLAQCNIKLTCCSVHLLQPSAPWCVVGSLIAAFIRCILQLQQPPAESSGHLLLQPLAPATICCDLVGAVQHQAAAAFCSSNQLLRRRWLSAIASCLLQHPYVAASFAHCLLAASLRLIPAPFCSSS